MGKKDKNDIFYLKQCLRVYIIGLISDVDANICMFYGGFSSVEEIQSTLDCQGNLYFQMCFC